MSTYNENKVVEVVANVYSHSDKVAAILNQRTTEVIDMSEEEIDETFNEEVDNGAS